jgi:hypothetical protein
MSQREPVPELHKEGHSYDRLHALATGTALEADSCILATGIDKALAKGSTEPRHRILVLVRNDLGEQLVHRRKGWRSIRLLNENHGERYEGPLAHEAYKIFCHGLQEVDHIVKQSRDLFRVLEQKKSERSHSCSSYIVGSV